MFAAIVTRKGNCAVYSTKREGFTSVITRAWCGEQQSAGDGVLQLPDVALSCADCKLAIANAEAVLAPSVVVPPTEPSAA